MKNKSIYLLLFCFFFQKIIAQNKPINIPSPNVAELGKYGQVPVSYFNGLPQISIPLYTVECRDIKVPISLSYYASGIKPEEHPGWVGAGWNLNAGGMITRVINGIRDELTKEDYEFETMSSIKFSFESGYYYRAKDVNVDNWASEAFMQKLMVGNDFSYNYLDTQPDEFIFNFNGHSGSFYFIYEDGQIKAKVKSKDGTILKVDAQLTSTYIEFPIFEKLGAKVPQEKKVARAFKTFQKFTVTGSDGTIYEFGGDINNIDFTTSAGGITVATAWHLSKITSKYGVYLDFKYIRGGDVFLKKKSNFFYMSYIRDSADPPCVIDQNENRNGGLSMAIQHNKYLSEITTSDNQIIRFATTRSVELDYDDWNDQNQYHKNIVPSLFIQTAKRNWNDIMLQDHYYLKLDRITVNNLKRINFFYTNDVTKRLQLTGVSETAINNPILNDMSDIIEELKYNFKYNETKLPPYNSKLTDNWGYYNNINYGAVKLREPYELYSTRTPDFNYMKAEILEKIFYPTGGMSLFEYQANDYSNIISGLEINSPAFSIFPSKGIAGGLRIKSITNYPNVNDLSNKLVKSYSYLNSDNKTSSGILSGIPTYKQFGAQHKNNNVSDWSGLINYHKNSDYSVNYVMYSENMILPLANTNGSHITYSRVTETEFDGSYTIYTYTNHQDFPDELPLMVGTNIDGKLLTESFTSRELERGLLKSTEIYNNNNRLVKETHFKYNDDLNRYNTCIKTIDRRSYSVGKCALEGFVRFAANKIYCFYPYLKTKTETIYADGSTTKAITTVTNYAYDSYNNLTSKTTTNSQLDAIKETYTYPYNYPTSSIYTGMVARNILAPTIEITKTKTKDNTTTLLTRFKTNYTAPYTNMYLPQSIQEQKGGSLLETRQLFNQYDNVGNLLEAQKSGNIKESYLYDYNNIYPVAEVKNAAQSEIAYTSFEADGMGNWDIPAATPFSSSGVVLASGVTGNKAYNLSGRNLKTASNIALLPAKTYVITYWSNGAAATISGSAAQVLATKGSWTLYQHEVTNVNAVTISGTVTIDELRLYPKDAQMRTYTYAPLIGMTTQADANNTITYYEYDNFGRLQRIKDQDKNILKTFDYRYQQTP